MYLTSATELQRDLTALAREYLGWARAMVGEDPDSAITALELRRRSLAVQLHRMTQAELQQLLSVSPIPMSLSSRTNINAVVNTVTVSIGFRPPPPCIDDAALVMRAAEIQYSYWSIVRDVARSSCGTAMAVFGLGGQPELVEAIASSSVSALRRLARMDVALALQPSVAFDLLISMVANQAAADRVAITGTLACASQAPRSGCLLNLTLD